MDPLSPACPVCSSPMTITTLRCPQCDIKVEGRFRSAFEGLAPELLDFAERFVRARGNLREMERSSGLSYPALRSRLDDVVAAMGGEPPDADESAAQAVIERLRSGDISPNEAIRLIRGEAVPDEEGEDTHDS